MERSVQEVRATVFTALASLSQLELLGGESVKQSQADRASRNNHEPNIAAAGNPEEAPVSHLGVEPPAIARGV